MNVRSVTCFLTVDRHCLAKDVSAADSMAHEVRASLERAGYPVQTIRLATQPLDLEPPALLELATELAAHCAGAGFEYLSVGPVATGSRGTDPSRLDLIPRLIRADDSIFATVLVAMKGEGIHLDLIRRAARAVRRIASSTELGFGNLRLAVLANVGPHAPFFPAAYHDGGSPALALATESADLAVTALSQAGSLGSAQRRLIGAVESRAAQLVHQALPVAQRHGARFAGIDFSLAPFPEEARSIGAAVERLGVDRFGASGTLFAASFLTGCLRSAQFPRCGFNGLMLPVLEDAILAERSQEGLYSVNDLLLYSAVCGTGLDTVPLPGDVSEEELAGILLDVATLALRLDKPLTARLMPIPGARAGDLTEYDFPYFANGRILDVKGLGSPGIFDRGGWVSL